MNKKFLQIIAFSAMTVIGWGGANASVPMYPCAGTPNPYLHYLYPDSNTCEDNCRPASVILKTTYHCTPCPDCRTYPNYFACCLGRDPNGPKIVK